MNIEYLQIDQQNVRIEQKQRDKEKTAVRMELLMCILLTKCVPFKWDSVKSLILFFIFAITIHICFFILCYVSVFAIHFVTHAATNPHINIKSSNKQITFTCNELAHVPKAIGWCQKIYAAAAIQYKIHQKHFPVVHSCEIMCENWNCLQHHLQMFVWWIATISFYIYLHGSVFFSREKGSWMISTRL